MKIQKINIDLIGTVTNQSASIQHQHTAKIWLKGQKKAFLLDTGTSTHLISNHDVDIMKLDLAPGKLLKMWNGSPQRSLRAGNYQAVQPQDKTSVWRCMWRVIPAHAHPRCSHISIDGHCHRQWGQSWERLVSVKAHSEKSKKNYIVE